MVAYRFYTIRGEHVCSPSMEALCADDADALAVAEDLSADAMLIEVWQDARLVGEVEAS